MRCVFDSELQHEVPASTDAGPLDDVGHRLDGLPEFFDQSAAVLLQANQGVDRGAEPHLLRVDVCAVAANDALFL